MTTVYAFGVFDMLHVGHLNLLEQAKAFGDRLIVGVVTDEVAKWKHVKPVIPYEDRKRLVAGLRIVDAVVEQHEFDPTNTVQKLGVDVLVHGDDWPDDFPGKEYMESIGKITKTVPYYPFESTTMIKSRLGVYDEVVANNEKDLLEMKKVLDECKIKFVLYGGACLGAIRDHHLIAWDWDIDLCAFEDVSVESLENMIEVAKKHGFDCPVFDLHGRGFDFKRNVQITLHWYGIQDGWVIVHGEKHPEFGFDLFTHPVEMEFLNTKFFVPNPPEAYLLERFGEDWRIPKIETRVKEKFDD